MKTNFICICLLLSSITFSQTGCWDKVFAGRNHAILLKNDGSVWGVGNSSYGQLGFLSSTGIPINLNTTNLNGAVKFALGDYKTYVIKSNGTLWLAGVNENNFANGSPIQIGTDNDWQEISTGLEHAVALKSNGTLWAWGKNTSGQLGIGTWINQFTPTQIGTDSNWSKVECGGGHTLAIKTNGTLWSWGKNLYGQVGNNTLVDQNVPIQIGISSNWFKIDSVSTWSVALKTDGTLWAWGYNLAGQLGDGTLLSKSIPTQIGSSNEWSQISTGGNYTLALKNNGTVWGCGRSSFGELGFGPTIDPQPNLLQIPGLNTILKVTAGYFFNMLIDSQNNIYAWGDNSGQQLANGNTNSVYIPTNFINCNNLNTDENFVSTLNIFPNPASTNLNFSLSDNSEISKITLTDLSGKKILEQNGNLKTINIENLANGMYILEVFSGDFKMLNKFIKN